MDVARHADAKVLVAGVGAGGTVPVGEVDEPAGLTEDGEVERQTVVSGPIDARRCTADGDPDRQAVL